MAQSTRRKSRAWPSGRVHTARQAGLPAPFIVFSAVSLCFYNDSPMDVAYLIRDYLTLTICYNLTTGQAARVVQRPPFRSKNKCDREADAAAPARTRSVSGTSRKPPQNGGRGIVLAGESRLRARELPLRETRDPESPRSAAKCPRAEPALARPRLKYRPIPRRVSFCTRPSARTCRSISGQ